MSLPAYEKLASFYLGKRYDVQRGAATDELLLYDAKDLCTHAVCVGMTGSGKTGLCVAMLEEAAIDGVPAICIDPKGDLANLLLSFPGLRPADFRPWIDDGAAMRKGMTGDQFAAQTAKTWKEGLAAWGQEPERIERFRDAVDFGLYTPGSTAATPLSVIKSFAAPGKVVLDDGDAFRERIAASTASLLALMGVSGDPLTSREHILVSNLLAEHWKQGRSLSLPELIRGIQKPPFSQVGVFDVETFFPAKDRLELAMRLNHLVASPTFSAWTTGEPLDIQRLLYTATGKPRLSILSIAHLSDTERMFFVTLLLSELIAWMRSQPGTSSLRALLYMDEVFGYFPPVANPPSKQPMLTLLKQARAFGLGCVLATQNPVDLDYKGLSNAGTWLIGRLQTARDQARVMEGLEGASSAVGKSFDKQQMERTLAGLGSRVFLMNNVHDDAPVVFQTRWAMSYLRGPLTRAQLKILHEALEANRAHSGAVIPTATSAASPLVMPALLLDDLSPVTPTTPPDPSAAPPEPASEGALNRPVLPPAVEERFAIASRRAPEAGKRVYRPALFARCRLHFVSATYKVNHWEGRCFLAPLIDPLPDDVWSQSSRIEADALAIRETPAPGLVFAPAPPEITNPKSYPAWEKDLEAYLYQTQSLSVFRCQELNRYSEAGETEGEFKIRLAQHAREERDIRVEKLRQKFAKRLATLKKRIDLAEAAVHRERDQYRRASFDSVVSMGSSILGAFLGAKLASRTNVSKTSTSMRSVGRAAQQRGDIGRAKEKLEGYKQDYAALEAEFEQEVERLEEMLRPESLTMERLEVPPRKSDLSVESLVVAWIPWTVDAAGIAAPAVEFK